MRQRVFRIGGEFEIPLVNVGINDLIFVAVPFMLTYRFASELHPIIGLLAAVVAAFVARSVLFWWKRTFPGKTFTQFLRWFSQADVYVPRGDTRTQRVTYER